MLLILTFILGIVMVICAINLARTRQDFVTDVIFSLGILFLIVSFFGFLYCTIRPNYYKKASIQKISELRSTNLSQKSFFTNGNIEYLFKVSDNYYSSEAITIIFTSKKESYLVKYKCKERTGTGKLLIDFCIAKDVLEIGTKR